MTTLARKPAINPIINHQIRLSNVKSAKTKSAIVSRFLSFVFDQDAFLGPLRAHEVWQKRENVLPHSLCSRERLLKRWFLHVNKKTGSISSSSSRNLSHQQPTQSTSHNRA